MKKETKGFVSGVITSTLALAMIGTAAATIRTVSANLEYNNVKLALNGSEFTPEDAGGNYVEPFIINGTTYLPVRAVAEAAGMDVSWDDATKTVNLSGGRIPLDDFIRTYKIGAYKDMEEAANYASLSMYKVNSGGYYWMRDYVTPDGMTYWASTSATQRAYMEQVGSIRDTCQTMGIWSGEDEQMYQQLNTASNTMIQCLDTLSAYPSESVIAQIEDIAFNCGTSAMNVEYDARAAFWDVYYTMGT